MTTKTVKWLSAVVVLFMLVIMVPQTSSAEGLPTVVITEDTVLTADLNAHVVIGADGITFDGAGHYITGDYTGVGINLTGRSGVTIKNCCVSLFTNGILLNLSDGNTLTNNMVSRSTWTGGHWAAGILLESSSFNILSDNIATDNWQYGFRLLCSDRNILTGNIANGNSRGVGCGFSIDESNHNTLERNTASANYQGFVIFGRGNVVADNTASGNDISGFRVGGQHNHLNSNLATGNSKGYSICGEKNKLVNNTANDNRDGFCLYDTLITHNILMGNNASNSVFGFALLYYDVCYNKFIGNSGYDNLYDVGKFGGAGVNIFRNLFINNMFDTIGWYY